ncbi:MAG: hypothetical protein QOE89_3930 [Pseudonocardiales bacterium]|nr:hypothetical protein [Pseudonocardiales bacterium]
MALPDSGQATAELPLTGERTLPDVASENYWLAVSLAVCKPAVSQLSRPSGEALWA